MSISQVTMVSLEELVNENHQYRKFKSLFNFEVIEPELKSVESATNYKGYGTGRLFKCLLLQFIEDLSDRELERYLGDSNAAKWFCDFSLTETTPDHKEYCTSPAKIVAKAKRVYLGAIKKNNMKDKNFDLDKYYTKIRSPFERVFSQDNKRARYAGIAKNQFAVFMNAICFNLKRLCVLVI